MPNRDGTGPYGQGPVSQNFGSFNNANDNFGNRGYGFGMGRGPNCRRMTAVDSKEVLKAQKAILQSRLDIINKQLDQN